MNRWSLPLPSRRATRVGATAAFLFLLVPAATAGAATVSLKVDVDDPSGGRGAAVTVDRVALTGGPENDVMTVRAEPQVVVVSSAAAPLTAGEGCTAVEERAARCAARSSRVRLVADVGAGDDRVEVSPFDGVTLIGGPGADHLEVVRNPLRPFPSRGEEWAIGDDPFEPSGAVLAGGPGPDTLVGGGGALVHYGSHTEALRLDLRNVGAPQSGAGGDRLSGISAVVGGAGDDRILAGRGIDIAGGPGDDVLTAAADGTLLDGGTGADTLRGGPGDDRLGGGHGSDALTGGAGDDELSAAGEVLIQPVITPVSSKSYVVDAATTNTLRGGPGRDVLVGGSGRDAFSGGPGFDQIGYEEAGGAKTRDDSEQPSGRDTVVAADGGPDGVVCAGAPGRISADAADVTLSCGRNVRRRGAARPGFLELPGLDSLSVDQGVAVSMACPAEMRRGCRVRGELRAGGRAIARKVWRLAPGHPRHGSAGDQVLKVPAAVRRSVCAGRATLRLTLRTRDARGRAVVLRARIAAAKGQACDG